MAPPEKPAGKPFRGTPAWQLSCLGDRLCKLGRYEPAIVAYRHALELAPDRAELHNSLGVAQHRVGAVDEAVAAYHRALAIDPRNARAHSNLGAAHMDRNEPGLAIAAYERALAIGRHPKIRTNLAFAQMLQGDLTAGWRNYESRWAAGARRKGRAFTTAPWLGERPLAGRSIILASEQGFGDMMQFVRYVPLVAGLGARVRLEADSPLCRLFAASFPHVESVHATGSEIPDCDEYCPVPSLPHAFRTEMATIPVPGRYLRAPERTPARWPELGPTSGRPRVALAWSGNPTHHNDRNRSIPFERFRALLDGLPHRFVSAQKEVRESDAAALARTPAVAKVADRLADFADTAALLEEVDLVISVDTSVAHLAGALGKKVWVLLPFAPDWRWLLGRNDSPWYPGTMELFRQARPGDWESVFAEVRERLKRVDLSMFAADPSAF